MKSIALVGEKVEQNSEGSRIDSSCKRLLISRLNLLKVGHLILSDHEETWHYRGEERMDLVAEIHVHDIKAYRRVLFGGTIGAGESYMLGLWSSPNPTAVVKLMVANQSYLQNMDSRWSWVRKALAHLSDRLKLNSISGAKKNIGAHYDLSNDFFKLFLDPTMMYSSAIYPDDSASLEVASQYKLSHICERLQLTEEDHLIEIGSGWGGMAIFAASNYGCKVTTTTISDEQYAYAKEAIRAHGLQDKITLLKKDYRLLQGKFDKLVSIEMIEAVGHRFYKQFFTKCNELLKDNGLALVQAIMTGDNRFDREKDKTDFIRSYIFPGGCLPSHNVISQMLKRFTDMHCVGYEDITLHYSRTLKDWRERFLEKLPEVRMQGFDDIFIRMWEFYLAYCEGGFAERVIHTGQYVFAKPQAQCLPRISH